MEAPDQNAVTAARLITRFAASYDYDGILQDAEVARLLQRLMKERLPDVLETMQDIRVPIDVVSGDLAVRGWVKNSAQRQEAVVCVGFHPLRVNVAIYEGNELTVYSHEKRYDFVPACIHQWIHLAGQRLDVEPKSEGEFVFKLEVVGKGVAAEKL